jgi:hypothetical protein
MSGQNIATKTHHPQSWGPDEQSHSSWQAQLFSPSQNICFKSAESSPLLLAIFFYFYDCSCVEELYYQLYMEVEFASEWLQSKPRDDNAPITLYTVWAYLTKTYFE